MFKVNSRIVASVLFIFLLSGSGYVNGQIAEHEIPALKKRAMDYYEAGKYAEAIVDLRKLMGEYPQDAMYKYYTGISLVKTNKKLDEAVELLYFASTRGVPEDVYYYLGDAYRKLYDFNKAKQFYLQFDKEAARSLAKEKNSKFLIRSVGSAIELTATYNPYEVLNVTFMNLMDPEQHKQVRMKGGVLSLKPEEFFTEKEDRDDLNALMFMPQKVERGGYVYFSGFERSGRNGFQIMRAKMGNTGKWTNIEPLDGVNTEQDEIMPYFDPVGKDLYFASEGLEGIGGFDLFRSHYDEERDEWTTPINLGFPVNSAYDEYLLLPGTDLGMVMFFSARQTIDTAVTVFRVHLSEPKQSLSSATPEEIRRIANLGGVAGEAIAELEAYQELVERMEDMEEGKQLAEKDVEETPIVDKEYQALVAKGLGFQAVSDSLTELATDARMKVRESKDPNDKWLYQKQIMVWERTASEQQALADEVFAKVAQYESSVPNQSIPEAIEKDTVIGEMTVYRYANPDSVASYAQKAFERSGGQVEVNEEDKASEVNVQHNAGELVTQQTEVQPEVKSHVKAVESGNDVNRKILYRFEIVTESPYSIQNPIPMNLPLPDGAFYRIQLGVVSNPAEPNAFKGITPVSGETIPDRNLIKYYAGKFSRYADAQRALQEVRNYGFEDAFIVSWYNGQKMSSEKVIKLEKGR